MDREGPEAVQTRSWYALQVRSCSEGLVAGKLENAGVESYFPHVIVTSQRRHREMERALFPGYLFARFDLLEKSPVVAVEQVTRILGFGSHAVEVPESEITAVKIMLSSPAIVSPCAYLTEGARVRVKWGPMVGLEGFVVRAKKKTLVTISVTAFEQSRTVEVERDSLELIKERKPVQSIERIQLPLAA
jgi:transcription antitermination factor NusG